MQAADPSVPLTRDLVLLGGGHTHALVLRMWGMRPLPGARLTLVSPSPVATYSGMLPGYIAGHYRREALEIDLFRLCRFAGARLVLGRAGAINLAARLVTVPGRTPIAYDALSVDTGISSALPDVPGFAQHAVPAKPLEGFAEAWEQFTTRPAAARARVVVIGGGVAGAEIAMAVRHRLGSAAEVAVIEAAPQAFPGVQPGTRTRLLRRFAELGVRLMAGRPVAEIAEGVVHLTDGTAIDADFIIGTAGARAPDWLGTTGLHLTDGFVTVDATLTSVSAPQVFAAGDVAHLSHALRPKAGVFAVRAAPVLFANLRAAMMGLPERRRFAPQQKYLKLISTGARHAIADRPPFSLGGGLMWRWKDRIDRRFMRLFGDLPLMEGPTLPAEAAAGVLAELQGAAILCAGCGAKVGPEELRAALAGLPAADRPDLICGAGDDAAVLAHGAGHQVITTDHLRAFTADPWAMARIAAVHALGDIWAMGARPQVALAQVILPRMSPALQARSLAEIMGAASAVMGAAGADIVGGHTSMGAELSIGFTVTGLSEAEPVGLGGARPGDALILTKCLGTGVILAAEMRGAAVPRVVAHAHEQMARGSATSAAILASHAHAMTDVTGFGLAGHLLSILQASGVGAEIDIAAVKLLPGAEELAAAGHGSSLLAQNRGAASRMKFEDTPRTALLFDPQTSGGLLAAVPPDRADALVGELLDAGEDAARIGRIVEGAPFLTVSG